jgi:CMP-N-acetylneuraminic acid synthetase
MNITCVISARGGSKGVAGKNFRPLLGKPLIAWSIEQALACLDIMRVVVSTDSEAIAEVSRAAGAHVPFMRPDELANDTAGKWAVWQHALAATDAHFAGDPIELFVDLDCTSPLRDVDDISKAIAQFRATDKDAVFTVCEARKNPYFNMLETDESGNLRISKQLPKPIVRRQDAPKVVEHVASIYVLSPDYLRRGTGLLSGRTEGYDIGPAKSLDIDSEFDFELVAYLMRKRLGLLTGSTPHKEHT